MEWFINEKQKMWTSIHNAIELWFDLQDMHVYMLDSNVLEISFSKPLNKMRT